MITEPKPNIDREKLIAFIESRITQERDLAAAALQIAVKEQGATGAAYATKAAQHFTAQQAMIDARIEVLGGTMNAPKFTPSKN